VVQGSIPRCGAQAACTILRPYSIKGWRRWLNRNMTNIIADRKDMEKNSVVGPYQGYACWVSKKMLHSHRVVAASLACRVPRLGNNDVRTLIVLNHHFDSR
jgi:hypothetical protein